MPHAANFIGRAAKVGQYRQQSKRGRLRCRWEKKQAEAARREGQGKRSEKEVEERAGRRTDEDDDGVAPYFLYPICPLYRSASLWLSRSLTQCADDVRGRGFLLRLGVSCCSTGAKIISRSPTACGSIGGKI